MITNTPKLENPLKELFGFAKDNKITREEFLETRKLLESRLFVTDDKEFKKKPKVLFMPK